MIICAALLNTKLVDLVVVVLLLLLRDITNLNLATYQVIQSIGSELMLLNTLPSSLCQHRGRMWPAAGAGVLL